MQSRLSLLCFLGVAYVAAFVPVDVRRHQFLSLSQSLDEHAETETAGSSQQTRRSFAKASAAVVAASLFHKNSPARAVDEEVPVFKTASGLKYIDLQVGTGESPQYGQLCSIQYAAYIKLPASAKNPNPKPELFEKQSAYLLKHGNGRTIPGLDEGLHTMKVGGKRRLLIPPKLGYIENGLGPIPEYPWDRRKLNQLLTSMVEQAGGTVIFEVTLLSAIDDEADQGYYSDDSLSPEDFDTLRKNLQRKVQENRAQQQDAV
jgi:FKBP-type peptidyl-prolyl cis-trans isomerase